jgi:para-aminobenzoate synthetase component I
VYARQVMFVLEITQTDAADAARRLRRLGDLTFLDSAMAHPSLGRYSLIAADPFAVFRVEDGAATWNGATVHAHPLAALKQTMQAFREDPDPALPPFQGGAAGFFSYDFGRLLERLPTPARRQPGVPQALMRFYDVVLAFDHLEHRTVLMSTGHPETDPVRRTRRARDRAEQVLEALSTTAEPVDSEPHAPLEFRSSMDRGAFERAVARVVEYVLAGDVFQANIARRIAARLPRDFDRFAFYQRLRRENPAPFAAWLDCGDLSVASSSPERFVQVRDGRVEARPIKGTIARSADPLEDERLAAALLASEKDRAENVMIVDLLRNDLSRVCRPHSVNVPVLNGLESYASVHHLVSVVEGILADGRDVADLIGAAFPGGSITGAPKIRAMEIISEIEGIERGVYCGSIGYLGFEGSCDLNIAIRTVTFVDGEAVLHAGGGITALSDPSAEYEETVVKAARILQAFSPSAAAGARDRTGDPIQARAGA